MRYLGQVDESRPVPEHVGDSAGRSYCQTRLAHAGGSDERDEADSRLKDKRCGFLQLRCAADEGRGLRREVARPTGLWCGVSTGQRLSIERLHGLQRTLKPSAVEANQRRGSDAGQLVEDLGIGRRKDLAGDL